MKKIFKLLLALMLSFTVVGCAKKETKTTTNVTIQEKELLTGDRIDYDLAEKLQEKLEKDGFVYSYNGEQQVATVISKDNKSTFTISYNAGNCNVTFTDENGEYKENETPSSNNFDTCKNLVNILNVYDTNFSTLHWSFVNYTLDQKKMAENSAIEASIAVTKMKQIGYTLNDKGGLSLTTTDTNGKNVTYSFNYYGEFQVSDGGDLPLLYKWKTNIGSMKYLTYDFNTDSISDVMGAFDNAAKIEFKINMMYLKQEFDKELARAGITIEDLNEYSTVVSNSGI